MRIWDIAPSRLCRQHLLGEHRELHAIWVILTQGRKAYAHHPEVMRWVGKLPALRKRHDALVEEMLRRHYRHHTPLPVRRGQPKQTERWQTVSQQRAILRSKKCGCKV